MTEKEEILEYFWNQLMEVNYRNEGRIITMTLTAGKLSQEEIDPLYRSHVYNLDLNELHNQLLKRINKTTK